jgi:hypothetical protein
MHRRAQPFGSFVAIVARDSVRSPTTYKAGSSVTNPRSKRQTVAMRMRGLEPPRGSQPTGGVRTEVAASGFAPSKVHASMKVSAWSSRHVYGRLRTDCALARSGGAAEYVDRRFVFACTVSPRSSNEKRLCGIVPVLL